MKEIHENDILRFTRAIPVPRGGTWQAALLCGVEKGETVNFRGENWTVEAVERGEFCGAPVYQAKLIRAPSGPATDKQSA